MKTNFFILILISISLGLTSCAFDAGDPFATLRPIFEASLEFSDARTTDDGYLSLESGYEIQITSARLTVGSMQLLASASNASTALFDPANPPDGYSNCHAGHCHAADGSLVDYEDIEAELAGGEAPTLDVALELSFDAPIDLLDHERLFPTCISENLKGCGLGKGTIRRVDLRLSKLSVQGQVRDSEPEARIEPRDFELEIELSDGDELLFLHALDFIAERRGERFFDLSMHLELPGEMFDEIDWSLETLDLTHLVYEWSEAVFEVGEEDHDAHDHHDHDDHEHTEDEDT